jgi:hypothetical protein
LETPRHELLQGLQPGGTSLAKLLDTAADQIGIGTTGTKAELAGRQPALDLGGQPGQLLKKGFVAGSVMLARRDAVGQRRE